MRTTLTLGDDIYRRAKQAAARSGIPVDSPVQEALEAFLTRLPEDHEPAPLPTFDGFAPRPGVDFTRSSELLHDLETAG